ncbi:MAG: ketopantoate reductase C-terminal domain-containing protein, partial [Verrucomicrobiales bacterium]|nr:ketopantoate reductase C-terminal domain-containing protein [Verrucomicrobiales bacterium]
LAQGQISIGEYDDWVRPRTHDIATEFKRWVVTCSVVENLAREQWKKLVWNVPFNGLSIVAGGIDTDSILADESLEYLVRGLMGEVIGGARALGYELPSSLVGDMVGRTKGMGAYKPSSMIDYVEGREVEVEAIWGEPVRRVFNAGAEVGRMETLYRLIKHAVAKRRGMD